MTTVRSQTPFLLFLRSESRSRRLAEAEIRSLPQAGDGTPIIIIENGEVHHERMHRMRLQEQDVMSVARQGGIMRLEQIDTAVVERNGAIRIFKRGDKEKVN